METISVPKTSVKKNKKKRKNLKNGNTLLLLLLPFMIIVFLFSYVPLFGWIYSMFEYVPGVSLSELNFVGLEYFKMIFNDENVWRTLGNTFIFATINIVLSPLPMIFAILLNEIRSSKLQKFVQTFTTLPNFISWVIIFSLAMGLFASDGLVTGFINKLGLVKDANSLLTSNSSVYWFQTFLGQWKGLGWSSIIYMAAIAGIDQELYEAAEVDGAGRFKCALHVTLPSLMETYIVLFIMGIGNFLSTGYEQYMLFKNPLVAGRLEVLDLYVYRIGLENMDYSYGVAIGIVKSIVSVVLVVLANVVAKKVRGRAIF